MTSDFCKADLQYRFFVVGERPYCLWDTDITRRTLEFLGSLDASYFEYVADTHIQTLDEQSSDTEKRSQHAALAIRTTYSQALETLFALIGAAIQAPRCVPAWILLYRSQDLHSVVRKIHTRKPILSMTRRERLSWDAVAEVLLSWLVIEDREKEVEVKKGFGRLWSRFASNFLDENITGEYNSIKHGLRIRPGGFWLAVGLEDTPGVPASPEKMRLLGKSDFGSSYLECERIGAGSHHIRLVRHHRNWHPEGLGWGLHLISMSISNVVSALRILNGVNAEGVRFVWPSDTSVFGEPWKRSASIGVTSMKGFDITIPPEWIEPFSEEVILEMYRQGQDAGATRRSPDDSSAHAGE